MRDWLRTKSHALRTFYQDIFYFPHQGQRKSGQLVDFPGGFRACLFFVRECENGQLLEQRSKSERVSREYRETDEDVASEG